MYHQGLAVHVFRIISLFVIVATSANAQTTSWAQFRGPGAMGVATKAQRLPTEWSETKNVEWKKDIPGRGWSSPVVWGERIFLTTVINTGESEFPKKGLYFGGNRTTPPESTHRWVALCLNLKNRQHRMGERAS